MDNNQYKSYLKSGKWSEISHKRMEIDRFECQCCGSKGTSVNPLEVHHLSYKYLYHEENRIYEDLVTLCHCCHKSIHRVMNRVTSKSGKRGWRDNSSIPEVHVFSINGSEKNYIEVGK